MIEAVFGFISFGRHLRRNKCAKSKHSIPVTDTICEPALDSVKNVHRLPEGLCLIHRFPSVRVKLRSGRREGTTKNERIVMMLCCDCLGFP